MIFLGIRRESGIAWELVKSNDLSPTQGRLYKGLRADKKVSSSGKLGKERENK